MSTVDIGKEALAKASTIHDIRARHSSYLHDIAGEDGEVGETKVEKIASNTDNIDWLPTYIQFFI